MTAIFANGGALIIYSFYLTFGWIGGENLFHPVAVYLFMLLIRLVILLLIGTRTWLLVDEFNPPSKAEMMCDYSSYE